MLDIETTNLIISETMMTQLLSKENPMDDPAEIECKGEFLSRRKLLWQRGAELAVQLEGRLIAKHHDWSADDCRSVSQQLSYGLMVGQLTENTIDPLLEISKRFQGKKVPFAQYPCMKEWQSDHTKSSNQWGDPDATCTELIDCRTNAWKSLSGLLERHLAAINEMLRRNLYASLEGGATANDITSLVWERIQKRLLDGRLELKTHPEFRTYCRYCARDIISKGAREVQVAQNELFERRKNQEQGEQSEECEKPPRSPKPKEAISISLKDGVEISLPGSGKTPSVYLSVKELSIWINKMCEVLSPIDAYLLRKHTMDGLSFTELAEDPVLKSPESRSPDALRKRFNRIVKRLQERFDSEADEVL